MQHATPTQPEHPHGIHAPRGRPSSYWMQDAEQLFRLLHIQPGDRFADLGCGLGLYAQHAAHLVGPEGRVYALDRGENNLLPLKKDIEEKHLDNITPLIADLSQRLPIEDHTMDHALLATVLHAMPESARESLFQEIHRILKPTGQLIILEIKKEELGFGPPMHRRISPKELEAMAARRHFTLAGGAAYSYSYVRVFLASCP